MRSENRRALRSAVFHRNVYFLREKCYAEIKMKNHFREDTAMKKAVCLLLALVLLVGLCPHGVAAEQKLISADTLWDYLDTGEDPAAGAADRTAWTQPDFALSPGWKKAAGPFGSKRGAATLESGYTAKTVLAGCTASANHPAYFFRTEFTLADPGDYSYLSLTVEHDDGAIVYLNGTRVAAFEDEATDSAGTSLGKPFDENLQYGGATLGTPRTDTLLLEDLSLLRPGSNTVAVELHQRSAGSSDIWFHMPQLTVSHEPIHYPQTNIILNPGADETAMNFTWYLPADTPGFVQLCPQAQLEDGRFPADAPKYPSTTALTNEKQYTNKVSVTGLQPDTAYAYRLINGDAVTNTGYFRTPAPGNFVFAFTGDPQLGSGNVANDAKLWDHTLSLIVSDPAFSGARFLVTAGDQVNRGYNESHYSAFLQSPVLRTLPVAVSIGNHDNTTFGEADEGLIAAFGQHYNLPNTTGLGATTAGCDYWFAYNDVLFFMLNGNSLDFDDHRALMEQALAAEPDSRWQIVVMHQSVYSIANHALDADVLQRREALVPMFQELGVDLVLMGHDHTYCRTYIMDGLTPVTDPDAYDDATMTSITDPEGILYITGNSACGNRNYNIKNAAFPYAAVKNQEYIGNVSRIAVTDRSLAITTYRTTDMTVMDAFTIYRTSPGADLADRIAALEEPTAQELTELRRDYDALSDEEKQLVRNYDLLTAAEEAMQLQLTREAVAAAEAAHASAEAAAASAAAAAAAAEQVRLVDPENAAAAALAETAAGSAAAADAAAQKAKVQAEATLSAENLAAAETAATAAAAAAAEAAAEADAASAAAGSALALLESLREDLKNAKAAAQAALTAHAETLSVTTAEQQTRVDAILTEGSAAIAEAVTVPRVQAALADAVAALEASACPSEDFRDIAAGAWYHEAVDFVLSEGIMNGDGDDTFDPDQPLTRAMLVQILYNLEGRPAHSGSVSFADVPQKQWYYPAVTWAAEQGIVTGYDDTRFGPDDPLTREQLVTVFWRYAGSPKLKIYRISFDDGDSVSAYARRAVIWATETGIVNGVGGNRFDPGGNTTRAQTAQVILKFLRSVA